MPIRAELRKFYGKEWRTVTRPRILARAGHCCEECKVPDHAKVLRACGWWTSVDDLRAFHFWYAALLPGHKPQCLPWNHAGVDGVNVAGFPREICHYTVIVLTVAHLNHTPGDDRDENLKALCQWCHLNYDKIHHHETRATRKDAARPLLTGA